MSRKRLGVIETLRDRITHGARLLVAVSGGVDSTVLLVALIRLQREMGLHLEVAHVDHGLRPDSISDSAFVAILAGKYRLPFFLRSLKGQPKSNIEAWARRERYKFFRELLQDRELEYVLTAHTADDVAETLLMRLLWNKQLRNINSFEPRLCALRPLLNISREKILDYARAHGVSFCEDSTNKSLDFTRNKVRHCILPSLTAVAGHGVREILALQAQALAEDIEALEALAKRELKGWSEDPRTDFKWGSREWTGTLIAIQSGLPAGLSWRLVSYAMEPALGYLPGRPLGKQILAFLLGQGEKLDMPHGIRLCRRRGVLNIERRQ